MSYYTELAENFFLRYERPIVEELTVGFSGIDPQKKASAQGLSIDHEGLENLMGGNEDGHYHLTKKQLESMRGYFGNASIDGGYATTPEADYEATRLLWLNGGNPGW